MLLVSYKVRCVNCKKMMVVYKPTTFLTYRKANYHIIHGVHQCEVCKLYSGIDITKIVDDINKTIKKSKEDKK